jgi:hypothetical protein
MTKCSRCCGSTTPDGRPCTSRSDVARPPNRLEAGVQISLQRPVRLG